MPDQSNPAAGIPLFLPGELLDRLAVAVADELERRGLGAGVPARGPYLTTDEAADRLRCTRQRIFDLVHAGHLEPVRDGRRLLFRAEDLDAYLRGTTTRSTS